MHELIAQQRYITYITYTIYITYISYITFGFFDILNYIYTFFNIKEMDKLTLEDSFRELIKQRKWYVNSLRSPIQAKYDKATFQKGGKVPEERIRDYLAAAGWKCVQPELWEKT